MYAGGDPVNSGDPSGQAVNLAGAAAWAVRNLHTALAYYGNDCTDFVSQALYYGGGDPQNSPGGELFQNIRNPHYWFSTLYDRDLIASYTWRVAWYLADHFKLNGSEWLVKSGTTPNRSPGQWARIRRGDIIFANWKGSSFSGISHCGVIVNVYGGTPYLRIAQHSPDQITTLTYWVKDGGSDPHV